MGLTVAAAIFSLFCLVLFVSTSTAAAISTTTTAASAPTSPDVSRNISATTNTTTTTAASVTTTQSELNLWTYLPREWSRMCTVDYDANNDVDATITCHVTVSERAQWRLADLRTSLTSLVESSGLEVKVVESRND